MVMQPFHRKLHAAVIALLLGAAAVALVSAEPSGSSSGMAPGVVTGPAATSPVDPPVPALKAPPAVEAVPGPVGLTSTDEGASTVSTAGTTASSSSSSFGSAYPAQAQATRDPAVPATNYWALLIGINDYAGRTRDNVGSYQDARELRKHLLSLGWRSDHIALVANRDATVSRIKQAIRWLASKTDSSSVVVFHYAGHERPVRSSSDGDNESRDVALWASDNRLMLDGVLGRELGRVRAAKMWIDMAVCRAGGFNDQGMVRPGRVITYSSPERELSYEDPQVRHSVFGWYLLMEGMRQRLGDSNGDGHVTVEEAFNYSKRYVTRRTGGRQHPVMVDRLSGTLVLTPPPPPPPPAAEEDRDCPFPCLPTAGRVEG